MRPAWAYAARVAVVVLLTVLMFAVDLPAALSAAVQVLWVALIFVICIRGARDLRDTRLRGRRLETKDGPGLSRDALQGFDVRTAKKQGRNPEGPEDVVF
jgi:hypothetical protein